MGRRTAAKATMTKWSVQASAQPRSVNHVNPVEEKITTGETQGRPATNSYIIKDRQRQNELLQAANGELLARLQALEALVTPGKVQYSTAAARARAPNNTFHNAAGGPALGVHRVTQRREQFKDTTMYTEVARRARPQFRATQYVAGGAPGQHA